MGRVGSLSVIELRVKHTWASCRFWWCCAVQKQNVLGSTAQRAIYKPVLGVGCCCRWVSGVKRAQAVNNA